MMSSHDSEVIVTLHDLPTSVNGALSIDDDGTPCIHLNARLTHEAQVKAYNHEMMHLMNNDMSSGIRIDIAEHQADSRD